MRTHDHSWSHDHSQSLAGLTVSKPGAKLIGKRTCAAKNEVGQTRAHKALFTCGAAHVPTDELKGDFNVSDDICCFARNVADGIFGVPCCQWHDSPSAGHRADFLGRAFLRRAPSRLKKPRKARYWTVQLSLHRSEERRVG